MLSGAKLFDFCDNFSLLISGGSSMGQRGGICCSGDIGLVVSSAETALEGSSKIMSS